jgi:hypothetical protein
MPGTRFGWRQLQQRERKLADKSNNNGNGNSSGNAWGNATASGTASLVSAAFIAGCGAGNGNGGGNGAIGITAMAIACATTTANIDLRWSDYGARAPESSVGGLSGATCSALPDQRLLRNVYASSARRGEHPQKHLAAFLSRLSGRADMHFAMRQWITL